MVQWTWTAPRLKPPACDSPSSPLPLTLRFALYVTRATTIESIISLAYQLVNVTPETLHNEVTEALADREVLSYPLPPHLRLRLPTRDLGQALPPPYVPESSTPYLHHNVRVPE